MVAHGLTWGDAGNLSFRSGDDLYVTASGSRLGDLTQDDIVSVPLQAAPVGSGPARRPSKELPLHRAVYSSRPDAAAVLHGAPFHATLVACSDMTVPDDLFVETMHYLERVASVPYHHPGSQDLATAVGQAARSSEVLLLENHGVVVFGESLSEALQGLQVLELACRMAITARTANLTLRRLPPETVTDFRERAAYRPRRSRPS